MTREEILSIEGVKEDYSFSKSGVPCINIGNGLYLGFDEMTGVIDYLFDFDINNYPLKPISDIETLKQFLNFFDI